MNAPAAGAPRIILFTGKGGVGKTTLAAATALVAAEAGHRTMVLSADPAHSLGDVWGRRLTHRPRKLVPNLWAREVNVHKEIEESWGALRSFVARFLESQGVDEVLADELAVLPGAEELVSLLSIERHVDAAETDLLVVDCAPTASTLRLLAFPEAFHRSMERLFPKGRLLARALRPVAESYLRAPLPDDAALDQIQTLDTRLSRLHAALADGRRTSVRLVLTPQGPVLAETRRILSVLHLFGLSVDAIVANRMEPARSAGNGDGATSRLARMFAPVPLLPATRRLADPVGLASLREIGREVYGDADPAAVLHRDQPLRVRRDGGAHVLAIPLPLTDTRELTLHVVGEALVAEVGSFRRTLVLPRALQARTITDAVLEAGELRIRFAPRPHRRRQAAVAGARP